jgi:hypothetical protein
MRRWRKPSIRFLNRCRWGPATRLAVRLMNRWMDEAAEEAILARAYYSGSSDYFETAPSGDLVGRQGEILVPWQEVMARVEGR